MGNKRMQPGWYCHVQNPNLAAYFNGTSWSPTVHASALTPENQRSVTPLQPGHPGPRAPFERQLERGSQAPKSGAGWWWGISAGAVLVICGLLRGSASAGPNCGSPFNKSSLAEYMDALAPEYGLGRTTYAAECRSSLAEATGWVWAFVLLGVLIILASAIIMAVLRSAQGNRATAVPTLPTAASQIEHLARLRDHGLVTPEEFEWKKRDILRSS